MTYLIVGIDRQTFAPWHENVRGDDAIAAWRDAVARAAAQGIDLVVAAVIGPNSSVVYAPVAAEGRATSSRAA